MYRFKLTAPHYIHAMFPDEGPNEWEYEEIDQATGRKRRKRYKVPMYLDPKDPSNWNHVTMGNRGQAVDGYIVVAFDGEEGTADPRDYVAEGPPTLDMDPLDEASKKWQRHILPKKIDGFQFDPFADLPMTIADMMRQEMEKQITVMGGRQPMAPISVTEFEAMKVQNDLLAKKLEEMAQALATLTAAATPKVEAPTHPARRV